MINNRTVYASARTNALLKQINQLVSIIGAILLVPIYLRFLGVVDYGSWLAVGAFSTWFAVMDPGIANLLIQRVSASYGAGDVKGTEAYISSGALCVLIVSCILLAVGMVVAGPIVRFLDITATDDTILVLAFRLSLVSTALNVGLYSVLGVLQGLHLSMAAGSLLLCATLLRMSGSVALLFMGWGLLALPAAMVLSALIVLILAIVTIVISWGKTLGRFRINLSRLPEFAGLFAYSFGARLGKTISMNIDSVAITRTLGPEALVLYSITATAPKQSENLVNLPMSAMRAPLAHHATRSSSDKELDGFALNLMMLLVWLAAIAGIGLAIFNDDFIMLWVGSDKFAGVWVGFLMAGLCSLRIWNSNVGMVGFSLGEMKKNSVAEWVYSLWLIICIVFGAMVGGLTGVVIGHLVAQLTVITWYFPLTAWRRLAWGIEESMAIFTETLRALFCAVIAVCGLSLFRPGINSWISFATTVSISFSLYLLLLVLVSPRFRKFMTSRLSFNRR